MEPSPPHLGPSNSDEITALRVQVMEMKTAQYWQMKILADHLTRLDARISNQCNHRQSQSKLLDGELIVKLLPIILGLALPMLVWFLTGSQEAAMQAGATIMQGQ